jgi:predicted transcriptional regulator
MKPVPVRLSQDALDRIEKIAGKYGRPKFIREAVAEKLAREELSELHREGK